MTSMNVNIADDLNGAQHIALNQSSGDMLYIERQIVNHGRIEKNKCSNMIW